ncbi:MAG: dehydrogenase E1 component subunit alpha/beta [Acidobacteriota bacterium]|nr:dehydrogenase E1 component subunit alpha/beta [Acidobacteriota bacterium]
MPRDIDVLPVFPRGEITFAPIPLFQYDGDLKTEIARGLGRTDALKLLEYMLTIRNFEEMIIKLKNGKFEPLTRYKFIGATHLSIGQEAVAIGAMSALRGDDYITSTHRGHGHSIAKGAYALENADVKFLMDFVNQEGDPGDPRGLLDCAIQEHLNRTMAELFGKEEGYCRGRGGGMHIADFHAGHLGANAIVGGSYAIAVGAALASMKLGQDRLCLCIVGDGATNNGIAHEAYNFASMAQFKQGCPVIFLIENNQYGMTGQERGEVTGVDYLARRGAGYNLQNMHAEVVNGMDVLAVRDAVSRAADLCRSGQGPVLLECMTYRYMGHSLSDTRETYRSQEEEDAWQKVDPIKLYATALVKHEVASKDEVRLIRDIARERIERATLFAYEAHDPDPSTIYEGLFADTTSDDLDPKWATPKESLVSEPFVQKRDGQGRILYRHAVIEALMEEMLRDKRVVLYGEDVADYGGAFQATKGLFEVFGRERVFNTAISEAAIIGTAAGASMAGLRPVVELMYIDFILMTMDQLGNQAAKNRYMFGGKAKLPMVVRTTIGGGKGYAGQHSQSLEAVATMFPGLKVIAPSTAYDVKGLLKSAIRDDNPVVFIEHQHCYTFTDEVPDTDYTIPIGVARVGREGTDVTVVAYSWMYHRAMEAAALAEAEGISVEVVDPRTLVPLDVDTIAASVEKTGRLVCVVQAPSVGCFAEHIAYKVQDRCFASMKKPARIVSAHDVPPPMAATLEDENLPTPEKILANIKALMD